MSDDIAIALEIARTRLRQVERGQPVELERQFVREVGEQLALAAQGLLEAVRELQDRIEELEARGQ